MIPIYTQARLLVPVEGFLKDRTIPAGTIGTIIEVYTTLPGYMIEVSLNGHDLPWEEWEHELANVGLDQVEAVTLSPEL